MIAAMVSVGITLGLLGLLWGWLEGEWEADSRRAACNCAAAMRRAGECALVMSVSCDEALLAIRRLRESFEGRCGLIVPTGTIARLKASEAFTGLLTPSLGAVPVAESDFLEPGTAMKVKLPQFNYEPWPVPSEPDGQGRDR